MTDSRNDYDLYYDPITCRRFVASKKKVEELVNQFEEGRYKEDDPVTVQYTFKDFLKIIGVRR